MKPPVTNTPCSAANPSKIDSTSTPVATQPCTLHQTPQPYPSQTLCCSPTINHSGIPGRFWPTGMQPSALHRHPSLGVARNRRHQHRLPPQTRSRHPSSTPSLTSTPPLPSRIRRCTPASIPHDTRTTRTARLHRARPSRRAWSTRTRSWPGPWQRTPSTSTGRTGSSAAGWRRRWQRRGNWRPGWTCDYVDVCFQNVF